jgi:predicted Rossmann-fold nucleotide-binding protein
VIEIDDLLACQQWLALGPERPEAAFQNLDLRHLDGFESGSFVGCLFLSCELTPAQAGFLTTMGATVIRDQLGRPFTAHRARLYTPEELFAGFDPDDPDGYESTYDALVYRHWVESGRQYPPMIDESLARRLHDHSISDALYDELAGRRPVAVMGGHSLERGDPHYAVIARISRALTHAGMLMLSGGGPGAMEATHLGAWMAHFDDSQLDAAIGVLSPRPAGAEPGKEYTDHDWLQRAFAVRARWPLDSAPPGVRYDSIGIPTWMYGHEPPAAFATKIAKYFANSIREEGLLAVATHGVVFTPGSAGTIQEIFQDAAQNHYESFGPPAPMVLFGIDHWTRNRPVWPLLESIAEGYRYRHLITLTDDEHEVVDRILAYRPGS